MTNKNYRNKYFKYKNKYLNNKILSGGGNNDNNVELWLDGPNNKYNNIKSDELSDGEYYLRLKNNRFNKNNEEFPVPPGIHHLMNYSNTLIKPKLNYFNHLYKKMEGIVNKLVEIKNEKMTKIENKFAQGKMSTKEIEDFKIDLNDNIPVKYERGLFNEFLLIKKLLDSNHAYMDYEMNKKNLKIMQDLITMYDEDQSEYITETEKKKLHTLIEEKTKMREIIMKSMFEIDEQHIKVQKLSNMLNKDDYLNVDDLYNIKITKMNVNMQ